MIRFIFVILLAGCRGTSGTQGNLDGPCLPDGTCASKTLWCMPGERGYFGPSYYCAPTKSTPYMAPARR